MAIVNTFYGIVLEGEGNLYTVLNLQSNWDHQLKKNKKLINGLCIQMVPLVAGNVIRFKGPGQLWGIKVKSF